MSIIPSMRPRASKTAVIVAAFDEWYKHRSENLPEHFLVGIRGYYLNTMGKAGVNDRGIYDDAIAVVGPETFAMFNANTDPSPWRHGVATLLPGVHPYRLGNHGISKPGGGYPAFRPATRNEELPVKRDGESSVPSKRPGVAINIHKGGYTTTSSLGCQTIYPSQWKAFYELAKLELHRSKLRVIPYILTDGPIL